MFKTAIVKKLKNGKYRLYSRKKGPDGKRKNLGTFPSLDAVKKHERAVQYFKHQADDGECNDKETKILSKLSDIAAFLEKAGYPEGATKVYSAMDAIDGSLFEEDCVDSITSSVPDVQNALPGSMPYALHGGFGGRPSLFGDQSSILVGEIATELVSLANGLDKCGFYDEADAIDKILKELFPEDEFEIIEDLEKKEDNKKKHKTKSEDKDKEGVDVAVQSNGHVGTGVTDNSNAGMFQGFSDAYFYSSYGNLEGAYGPQ